MGLEITIAFWAGFFIFVCIAAWLGVTARTEREASVLYWSVSLGPTIGWSWLLGSVA